MRRWRGKTKIITFKMVNNPIRRQDKKLSLKPSAEIILLCIKKGSVRSFLSRNYRCITISTAPVKSPLRTAGDWPDRQDQDCSMVHATVHWRRHHTLPLTHIPNWAPRQRCSQLPEHFAIWCLRTLARYCTKRSHVLFFVSHNNPVQ